MIGAASILTLVTLTGLVAGFAREWLFVNAWGASARTDAFLIALFLPEAIRIILGGGFLASATMSLWQQCEPSKQAKWLNEHSGIFSVCALVIAAVLHVGAPMWAHLIGPGLSAKDLQTAQSTLSVLAWVLPALILQALWSVPLQASGRYVLAGLGSLLFNLPAVAYLAWFREQAAEQTLAWAFVCGAITSCVVLAPAMWRLGWRPLAMRWQSNLATSLGRSILPLLGGALVSQGVVLLERMVASYLGEGVVTLLNLARKLINLPIMALMAINQVLLGLLSRGHVSEKMRLMRQGMALVTTVSTGGALGILLAAPALVALLFPQVQNAALLTPFLSWYAVTLVVSAWNSLLIRYSHANGNTRLPFECDLLAGVVQAVSIFVLSHFFGVMGLVIAALVGVLTQGGLLWYRSALWHELPMGRSVMASTAWLLLASLLIAPALPQSPLAQMSWATVISLAGVITMALITQPWKDSGAGKGRTA